MAVAADISQTSGVARRLRKSKVMDLLLLSTARAVLLVAVLAGCGNAGVEAGDAVDAGSVAADASDGLSDLPEGTVPPPPGPGPCDEAELTTEPFAWSYAFDETPIPMASGEEAFSCEKFPVVPPPTARRTFLTGWDTVVDPGTHHQVLGFSANPVDTQQPCTGSTPKLDALGGLLDLLRKLGEGGFLALVATGEGVYSVSLGDGDYGIYLGETGDGHWESDHHLINLGDSSTTIGGSYELHATDHVAYPVARVFTLLTDIHVPAGQLGQVTGTVIAPYDLDVVIFASHMHEHGLRFEMFFYDGTRTWDEPFYVSEDWDSPKPVLPRTPVHLAAGQGITYTCHYHNFEDTELVLGSTKGSEMCSLWLYYGYPRRSGYEGLLPPDLAATVAVDGGVGTLEFDANLHSANETAAGASCPAAHP